LVGAALACLTHPILSYTTQIYPELLAALAFVSAARLVRAGRGATPLALAGAAACVGVLPWLSTRAALIALGVGLVIAYCALRPLGPASLAQRGYRVAAAAVPFFALLAALSFVNWRLFGLFMPGAAYYLVSDQQQVLTFMPQVGTLGLLCAADHPLRPRGRHPAHRTRRSALRVRRAPGPSRSRRRVPVDRARDAGRPRGRWTLVRGSDRTERLRRALCRSTSDLTASQ